MITKQGQSQIATEIKERGLFSAFEANLWLHRRKISFAPYFHFDLNSGCGFNYEVNCMGSPLAFLNAVELVKTQNFISVFCDNDSEKIAVLKNRAEIATDERCSCVCEDNKSLLLKIPDFIRSKKEKLEYATGMILSDPNGTDVPIDELSMISKELPRIDIAINFGSSSFKRCRGAFGESRPNLESMIHSLNKKHWYIREPIGRQQWTILVGRNVLVGSVKEMNELGFYGLDSSSGQDIFSRCNYTKGNLVVLEISILRILLLVNHQ